MPSALVPLATTTLASSSATVSFSSISGAYRDLRLVLNLGNNSNTGYQIRFNSDTGANYSFVYMAGNGSGTGSSSGTVAYVNIGSNVWSNSTLTNNFIIDVMDYSATDKHKTVLARGNDAATGSEANAARWANTAAITSVTVFGYNSSQMIAGSTLSLYGVSA